MMTILGDVLALFCWQDILEVLLLTLGVYKFSLWLGTDRQKNLVAWFYSAVGLLGLAQIMQLSTIVALYMTYWPAMVLLFIIIHQRSLQQNFVSLQKIKPAIIPRENWIEALVRGAFRAAQHEQEIMFYVEQSDSLQEYLTCPVPLQATLSNHTMDLIINSDRLLEGGGVWLNTSGELLGLNVTWQLPIDAQHSTWNQQALFLTKYVDALICKLSLKTRTFEIIAKNTYVTDASVDEAIQLITQYTKKQLRPVQGAVNYEPRKDSDPEHTSRP